MSIKIRILAGGAGGLVGGLAFGVLMQVNGLVLMVAQLFDSRSAAVGWVTHLAISVLFGLTFGLLFGKWLTGRTVTVLAGVGYGYAWWILGALIIMPTWLGTDDMMFRITTGAWQSLAGHVMYGSLLGFGYGLVRAALHQHTSVGEDMAHTATDAQQSYTEISLTQDQRSRVVPVRRDVARREQ
jgi:uncharacterized membrane protein YagU involved in acid resistance